VCCKSQQGRAGDQSQDIRQKKRLESLRIGDINCLLQARLALALATAAEQGNAKSLSTDLCDRTTAADSGIVEQL